MGKYELEHRFPIDRHDPIHPHNPHLGKLVHTWDVPTVLIDTLGVAERNDPEFSGKVVEIARRQQERSHRLREDEEEELALLQAGKLSLAANINTTDVGEIHHVEIPKEDIDLFNNDPAWHSEIEELQSQYQPYRDLYQKLNSAKHDDDRYRKNGQEDPNCLSSTSNPNVLEAYTRLGEVLSTFKAGQILPKTFKIIPSLSNWEEILAMTRPEFWSPHATYEMTSLFVNHPKARQTQRFFSLVLLDRIRDDLSNPSIYLCVKKAAMHCTKAFIKGFLVPLCESGTCTLQEAAAIGGILKSAKIPAAHTALALVALAELHDYTMPLSIFMGALLERQSPLPWRTIITLVHHFMRFERDTTRTLPSVWHQALLALVENYEQDLVPEQKEDLLHLVTHHHPSLPRVKEILSVARV